MRIVHAEESRGYMIMGLGCYVVNHILSGEELQDEKGRKLNLEDGIKYYREGRKRLNNNLMTDS